MKGMAGDSTLMLMASTGKQDRETLIACTMDILKDEKDDEILESILELVGDLSKNAGLREGLKNFRKNGCAVIRKMKKENYDSQLHDNTLTSSSSTVLDLEKAKPNSESGLNFKDIAMSNDIILQKMFEHVPVNDLKNCRLVSKRWKDLSLNSWRGKAVLRTERLFSKPIEGVNYDTDAAVEEFRENASKCEDKPFQRYDMNFDGRLLGRVSLGFEIKNKKMMLELFSSSIQHLRLLCDDWEMISILLTKLPQLRTLHLLFDCFALYRPLAISITKHGKCPLQDLQEPATSKLRKLELTVYKSDRIGLADHITFPWKKIFQSVPALKSLRVNIFNGQPMFEDIIQRLCELRKEKNFTILNLEELEVTYPIHLSLLPDRLAKTIFESQLPLQTLRIHLGDEDKSKPTTFSHFLNAHAKTLYSIQCVVGSEEKLPPIPLAPYFPSKVNLPKLKDLVLKTDCVSAFHLLSSLDTSNLENLTMEPEPDTCDNLLPSGQDDVIRHLLESDSLMGSCSYPNLKKFFLGHAFINLGATDLKCLAKLMPNVTDLGIPLAEETFPLVYELWPDLESLHVLATGQTYSLLDDEAITGFPAECNGEHLGEEFRVSSITDLKNLRKFALETNTCGFENLPIPRRPFITDLSAVNGFLQLPKLHILELETLCKFSPNVMDTLMDHVEGIKICPPDMFRLPH